MITTKLPTPLNQKAFILHTLLNKGPVSERDFNMNGFRSRISDLRLDYDLDIQHTLKDFTNEFGRKGKYREHFLSTDEYEKAIAAYYMMNKQEARPATHD